MRSTAGAAATALTDMSSGREGARANKGFECKWNGRDLKLMCGEKECFSLLKSPPTSTKSKLQLLIAACCVKSYTSRCQRAAAEARDHRVVLVIYSVLVLCSVVLKQEVLGGVRGL